MVDNNNDRASTASTASGLYKLLKSPAPICMFYFAHPFGVVTPQTATTNIIFKSPDAFSSHTRCDDTSVLLPQSLNGASASCLADTTRSPSSVPRTYIPWPESTWRRNIDVVPPLAQVLASQMGHDVPELETLIENIRTAWNSPTCRSILQSVPWRSTCEDSESTEEATTMDAGYCSRGPGLLRRRYSMPEIIMRKHSLSQQKSADETNNNRQQHNNPQFDYGSPTSTLNHLPPNRPPRHSTGTQFETNSSTRPLLVDRSSDPLQSPVRHCDTSMRRQLLRRIWKKECLQMDNRSGSWSPPLRRSQRRLNVDPVVEKCTECSRLEMEYATYTVLPETIDTPETAVSFDLTATTITDIPTTAASELSSPPETSTKTTSSSDRLTSNTELHVVIEHSDSPDINQWCTPDMETNYGHDDEKDNLNTMIDNDRVLRSNLSTIEPYSTAEIVTHVDSAETAYYQSKTDSYANTQSATPSVIEDIDNINDNQKHQEMAMVDRYIANLLIDSLNNVLASTSEANLEYNSSIREDNNFSSGQSDVNIISQLPESSSSYNKLKENQHFDLNQNQASVINTIYFPRYSSEMSVYSSILTDNDHEYSAFDKPSVIPVQSGSNYPNAEFVVAAVSRIVHRTESMEVQRASTTPYTDDSDTSLIDSLDDPNSPRPDDPKQSQVEPSVHYEKSQTFFVPIVGSGQQNTGEPIDMASAMPEKLRDKMLKRLQAMDTKKDFTNTKKLKKFEKKTNKTNAEAKVSATITEKNGSKKRPVKGKSKYLQSEIGLLESYTIDAKGNMQFQLPTKPNKAPKALKIRSQTDTSSSSISAKRPVVKKPVQSRRNEVISIKRAHVRKPPIATGHRRKEVQHLTLYQSDLITPDTECGPRRMYQKTEIHDGKKRIEILEIVECVDSSSSSTEESTQDEHSSEHPSEGQVRRSRIPVPVFKSGSQKSGRSATRSNTAGQIFVKNMNKLDGGAGNTKVDEMIANLLIEALNHPKELSIEFVKSPTEFLRSLTPNTPTGTKRLLKNITKCSVSDNPSSSSGRRLNSGPIKYHQVFDVIPEEKSSVSVDSSTEECALKETSATASSNKEGGMHIEEAVSLAGSGESSDSPTGRKARGKVGVESESEAAWMGFLKQHNENAHEEGNSQSNTNISSETCTTVCVSKPFSKQYLEPSVCNTVSVIDNTSPQTSLLTNTDQPLYFTSTTTSCMQCRMIDMDLNINTMHYSTATIINTPSEYNYLPKMSKDEWQVAPNDTSLTSMGSASELPAIASTTDIDTTSFIVVRDDCAPTSSFSTPYIHRPPQIPPLSHFAPSINTANTHEMGESHSQQRCNDCCFCNPDLHKRSRSISRNCSYCDRLNERWQATSPKATVKKDTLINKGTNTKPERFFETQSKTDHTHVRTRSKDSDTVSLKCTRINTKVRRLLTEDMVNGNVFENKEHDQYEESVKCQKKATKPPRAPLISPKQVSSTCTKDKQRNTTSTATHSPRSATNSVRLPSPFINNANSTSTQSYDSATSSSSQCSSSLSSAGPASPSKKITLPVARWQNHNSAGVASSREATLPAMGNNNKVRKSRYQHFYGHPKRNGTEDNQVGVHEKSVSSENIQTSVNQKNSGWSLTLAGTYRDDMAPDLEMRLSFPKRSPPNIDDQPEIRDNDKLRSSTLNVNSMKRLNNNVEIGSSSAHRPFSREDQETIPLSVTNVNNKILSKTNIAAKNTNRSNCNLPEVNKFDREAASETARKTIKRSQYSLAVASATTKTISKFGNGKRAMSYQTLNANTLCINNRDRINRDHSIDLGSISSRRLSLESPATFSDGMALSVLGNAIAPEQKPRVPTMSERDLTRKNHAACFKRNRILYS